MSDDPLDPALTDADAQLMADVVSEFFDSFVVIGVDLTGKNVSITHSSNGDNSRTKLLEAINWFYNNS